MSVELREEDLQSAASRALWSEYQAFLHERLGERYPSQPEAVFAREDAWKEPGAVWLVLYADGRPVACGGLRPLDAATAEVKRMFVTQAARRRGHGRRLLDELERRAAAAGCSRLRLLTTEALVEADRFYEKAGYRPAGSALADGRRDVWLCKELSRASTRAAASVTRRANAGDLRASASSARRTRD